MRRALLRAVATAERDNHEGCRYFDTEKYEREEKTEDKDVSG